MRHPQTDLWISFNGEIFNYLELRQALTAAGDRFVTASDTEVILHLYARHGERCVEHLTGQWAFAIWDVRNRKLFASRDRMGVRPFYYTHRGGTFLFASEIKALLASGVVERAISVEALDQILTFWAPLPPTTAFRGIYELPPGHSLTLHEGRLDIRRYWQLDYSPAGNEREDGVPAQTEELLHLLSDAVRLRLRADVPVGAYLSGGLDSTLTAALMRRVHAGKLHTFSIGFADPEYDESRHQREASRYLGVEHETLCCTYDDVAAAFPKVVWHAETPVVRTAPAPMFLLAQLARSSGFKVVVTGEGADVLLGGYDILTVAAVRGFWARRPYSRRRPLLMTRLYPYMNTLQSQSPAYVKSFFQVRPEDAASPFFSHIPRWTVTSRVKSFFSDDVRAALSGHDPYARLREQIPTSYSAWPHLCQAQYLETAYLLPNYILSSQGDRMGMAHAVESRFPFLDHRVVEFASRLPPRLKVRVLQEKYLLKRAAGGLIPESIRMRHKQPFRAPDGRSFFSSPATKAYLEDLLTPTALRREGLFDPVAVSRLVQKFRSGAALGAKDDMALVAVLSTQLLAQQFLHVSGDAKCIMATKSEVNCGRL
jgi:asparagine synthase (glutamine-hydrolysing)